eukprot:4160832-Prymnesium_polylepis.1
MERHRLSPSPPMSACETTVRSSVSGMIWASGGGVGALGDRAERMGQGVPERSAPGDAYVD